MPTCKHMNQGQPKGCEAPVGPRWHLKHVTHYANGCNSHAVELPGALLARVWCRALVPLMLHLRLVLVLVLGGPVTVPELPVLRLVRR